MTRKSNDGVPGATVKLQAAAAPVDQPPVRAVDAPRPRIVTPSAIPSGGEPIKKADFMDRAMARTDVKRRDAKMAIEAALAELANILTSGGEVNLPPLGKLKVVKSRDIGDGGAVMTLKLRSAKEGGAAAKSGVAEPGDDG